MAGDTKQRSRGGDMLSRCPDSHAEIAGKVGVDKSLVTRWISGARKPTDGHMTTLDALYGIPPSAWGEPVSKVAPRTAAKPKPSPLPPPPPLGDEDDDDDGRYDDETNTDRLRRFIREGMRELDLDTELSATKKAEALKKLVDAQVALDKSTGENALTMSRIAAHPEFRRILRLITEALAPHPEALASVIDVLRANP